MNPWPPQLGYTPSNPAFEARVPEIFAEARYVQEVGVALQRFGAGWCESRLALEPRHTQQDGYVHAAVQALIADHTAGAAAGSLVGPDEIVLTIEFKVNLLRPAKGQALSCRAHVLRPGRSVTVAEAEVFAHEAASTPRLVSKAMVTIAVVPAPARTKSG